MGCFGGVSNDFGLNRGGGMVMDICIIKFSFVNLIPILSSKGMQGWVKEMNMRW
jgi:hypothetical protein